MKVPGRCTSPRHSNPDKTGSILKNLHQVDSQIRQNGRGHDVILHEWLDADVFARLVELEHLDVPLGRVHAPIFA